MKAAFKNNEENSFKIRGRHFLAGKQNKWWMFYNNMGQLSHKHQLKDHMKNGYGLIYILGKLTKVSKYIEEKSYKSGQI